MPILIGAPWAVNVTIDLEPEEVAAGSRKQSSCLAFCVTADRIAHGEFPPAALGISFKLPDEQLALQ